WTPRDIPSQPDLLRRTWRGARLAVERDHVPGADVPAVVQRLSAVVAEVVAVALSVRGPVFVVSGDRMHDALVGAPARAEAAGVIGELAGVVLVVAERE